jgi:hypothetical protein
VVGGSSTFWLTSVNKGYMMMVDFFTKAWKNAIYQFNLLHFMVSFISNIALVMEVTLKTLSLLHFTGWSD